MHKLKILNAMCSPGLPPCTPVPDATGRCDPCAPAVASGDVWGGKAGEWRGIGNGGEEV